MSISQRVLRGMGLNISLFHLECHENDFSNKIAIYLLFAYHEN